MKKNIQWIHGKKTSLDPLKEIETELGIIYPEEYVQLIKNHNGASPIPNAFESEDGEGSLFSALILIENVLKEKQYYDEAFHQDIPEDHEDLIRYKSLVPFASDPGGSHLCFDFYKREIPAIIYLADVYHIHPIADSFKDFLNCLYDDGDY